MSTGQLMIGGFPKICKRWKTGSLDHFPSLRPDEGILGVEDVSRKLPEAGCGGEFISVPAWFVPSPPHPIKRRDGLQMAGEHRTLPAAQASRPAT